MMIVGQEGGRPKWWDGAWAPKMIGNVAREERGREGEQGGRDEQGKEMRGDRRV
jgi:hypothetical protein